MKILKNFSDSETKTIANSCIIFLQDENGDDWYESQTDFSAETLKIVFDTQ